MKAFRNLTLFLIILFIGTTIQAQHVGIGQPTPTNALHITPMNSADNPLRIDNLKGFAVEDTSIMVINPSSGIVKYINPYQLVRVLGVDFMAGPGIAINGNVISNTDPNQTVSITGAGGTTITGSYPNFTVNSPMYSAGTGITISPTGVIANSAQGPITLNGGGGTTITGTFPNFTISSTDNVNDADAVIGNEYITNVGISGTVLSITDGGGANTVNLNSLQDGTGTDDQTVDAFSLSGTTLSLSLEGDGQAPNTVNLGAIQDGTGTDDQTVDALTFSGTTLSLSLEGDGQPPNTVNLSGLQDGTGTDDQTVDAFTFSGTTLSLSLEGDGQAANTVNLSSINGDITGVNAGAGLTGGGAAGTPTITAAANNGLNIDATADRIQLGGALTENTTITSGAFSLINNLNGTGDFRIRDNGTNVFSVLDNGNTLVEKDLYVDGGWIRVRDNTGIVFQDHGGGFYMQDATWIRTFGSKSFYHNTGVMRTDGTLQVGSSGSTLTVPNNGNLAYRSNVLFANVAGNVGVGTNSPTYKLHVVGRVKSNGINETSDRRYKKDISNLENTLEKVMLLRGVNYTWRTGDYPEMNFEEGVQLGVIAQEIELVFPEVVQTDKEGYKSVEYSHLVPALIEAIKELNDVHQEDVAGLRQENQELKAQLNDITSSLNSIKAMLNIDKEVEELNSKK